MTENVAFLIDFDSNLMVFDMAFLAHAAVDNLMQKGNVGTTVIRHLSLVIRSVNKQRERNGCPFSRRTCPPRAVDGIAECGTTVIRHLSLVIRSVNKQGRRNGCPFSRRTCPPRAVGTAGGRDSRLGIRGPWLAARGPRLAARGSRLAGDGVAALVSSA
ncbi:MAG: hypothetical protein NTX87_17240 [Planctomycetota bacterium]|nr:hypothetical protein [Planctomycetota bacterium]